MAKAPVKGQATLDAANARKNSENNETAVATMTPESGYEKPKTLRQLEHIVESNALRGAGYWKKAADALRAIKDNKLWRNVINPATERPYQSFVAYAEGRFGFKKTYAYDLAKAATRKPEALTERAARGEMAAERGKRTIDRTKALELFESSWVKFENRMGDIRDRIDYDADPELVRSWDETFRMLGSEMRDFLHNNAVIQGEAETVSPKREDNDDLPPGHSDDDMS